MFTKAIEFSKILFNFFQTPNFWPVLSIKMKLIVEYYSVLPLPSHFSAPLSSVFVHILLFLIYNVYLGRLPSILILATSSHLRSIRFQLFSHILRLDTLRNPKSLGIHSIHCATHFPSFLFLSLTLSLLLSFLLLLLHFYQQKMQL